MTPKKKLTSFLKLGDSDNLQVGQKVLAIGNPFGLAGTLTTGIVSSLHRKIQGEDRADLEDMIQTDAAINSGNSGGPLLDSQGNVIGINTAIYGPNGGNIGIGFAMPINRAKVMLEDFTSGKRPASSIIGVSTYLISGDLAEALRLPRAGGLLIGRVTPRSPASAAGLRGANQQVRVGNYLVPVGGDFITAVDGKKVEEENAITQRGDPQACRRHARPHHLAGRPYHECESDPRPSRTRASSDRQSLLMQVHSPEPTTTAPAHGDPLDPPARGGHWPDSSYPAYCCRSWASSCFPGSITSPRSTASWGCITWG